MERSGAGGIFAVRGAPTGTFNLFRSLLCARMIEVSRFDAFSMLLLSVFETDASDRNVVRDLMPRRLPSADFARLC